jgi:tetratricopeptide (TPR) repeat protein
MTKQRVSRSRKRQLEEPDEFITFGTRLLETAANHKEKLSIALGVICIIIVGFLGMRYYSGQNENKASDLLGQNVAKYEMIKNQTGPDNAYLSVKKDFQLILEKYSGKDAGKLARIIFANICYNGGDYDKAIRLYQTSLEEFNENIFIKNQILSSMGHTHEKKKDYINAAKYFEMIVSGPDIVMKDEALFHLGKLYAEMGKTDLSINAFKKILSDYTDSIYIEMVREKVSG